MPQRKNTRAVSGAAQPVRASEGSKTNRPVGGKPHGRGGAKGSAAGSRKASLAPRFGASAAAYDSSGLLDLRLAATGNAQVFVFLKRDAKLSMTQITKELGKHFSAEKGSRVASLARARGGPGSRRPQAFRYYKNLGMVLGTVNPDGYKGLRKGSDLVASVELAPDMQLIRPVNMGPAPAPTDPLTWGLQALQVDQLWSQGFTGKGVLVAHLDTGLDSAHPALQDALGLFIEFDTLGARVSPSRAPYDSSQYGHGTHTAGTIAGRPVNNSNIGVAPGALLASAIVIEGGNVRSRVLGGIDWALEQGAQVLSMSLGWQGWVASCMPLIHALRQSNCLPVIAVGNEDAGSSRSPGNYVESLSVGACDVDGNVPDWSSSQLFQRDENPLVPDVIAPSVNVISAMPGGLFQYMSGTSMGAPHVAGLAALLRQAKPDASVDQIEKAIFGSCGPLPANYTGRAEYGLPNGPRALALL